MIAASLPVQRPPDARLLFLDSHGGVRHLARSSFLDLLRPGDLVIANDAATLPASLTGWHAQSGCPIEVRLAGHLPDDRRRFGRFLAIVFGAGDSRMRTEDRPLPPLLFPRDQLVLGPLRATIEELRNHPRLVAIAFRGTEQEIWEGLARHGRPIQYSHVRAPLVMWDVWTPYAGAPVAFEPPSAGFALDWSTLGKLHARGVSFATLTHAAGISSTGDPELDLLLPFAERYSIPAATAGAIRRTKMRRGRVIAVGTTVVRALEHAAGPDGSVPAGDGLATQRVGVSTRLRVVDAILSGTHEPGTSHYELLRAFADDGALSHSNEELNAHGYRTHEFGDSVFIEKKETELRWSTPSTH